MPSFSLDEFRAARGSGGELGPSPPPDLEADALAEFPSEARQRRAIVLPVRLGEKPHLLLPLLAAVVLGAAGGLWWVFAGPSGASPPPAVPLPATFLVLSVPVPLPAVPESALGYVAPGESSRGEEAPGVIGAAPREGRRERAATEDRSLASARAGRPPASAPPNGAAPTVPSRSAPAPPATPVDETVYASFSEPVPASAEAATRIYSADDVDVQPPVATRAWFFAAPPEGISRSSLTEIEVVVSPKGDVESAKIVAGPRTYTDGMILSAIKGGKFRPAQKDGQPVTYRQTLWVVVPDR